ncbi:hypothetical protein WBG83_09815 [Paenibacillus sp. y28]
MPASSQRFICSVTGTPGNAYYGQFLEIIRMFRITAYKGVNGFPMPKELAA